MKTKRSLQVPVATLLLLGACAEPQTPREPSRPVPTFVPADEPVDPHESEALRLDPVDSEDAAGKVTETMRPGYRLGDQLIRPARVAVGRKS